MLCTGCGEKIPGCPGWGRSQMTQDPSYDQTYDRGPVAALRRVAFLMERGREETRRVQAFRKAAATILPLPDGEVAGTRRGRDPDRARRHRTEHGSGDRGGGPGRGAGAAGGPRAGVRRAAHRRRARPAPAAARRPALPLRLVRRRLADRGDGLHRPGARPRLPRAHRPLAATDGRERAEPRPADQAARRRRRGQRPPRRLRLHAPEGDRGRHPRRRWPRPDRGDAAAGSTSGWPASTRS